jgi:hypothetical protein
MDAKLKKAKKNPYQRKPWAKKNPGVLHRGNEKKNCEKPFFMTHY